MSVLPSYEDLALELAALSSFLYGGLGLAELLGPTFREYDRFRDRAWCQSRPMLAAFGLPRTSKGWEVLLNRHGFQHPTRSQVKLASNKRREESRGRTYIALEDEHYPELLASSSLEVTTSDGTTYTYWSLR